MQLSEPLYQIFCQTNRTFQEKIKEIIALSTKNMLDLTKCLLMIHKKIKDAENKNIDVESKLGPKLNVWHDELISVSLNSRRQTSRLISDLKFLIGSLEGADSLFEEIDEISTQIRKNWSSEQIGQTSSQLKATLFDLSLILDPELITNTPDRKSEAIIIEKKMNSLQKQGNLYLRELNVNIFINLLNRILLINLINLKTQ